MTKAAYELQPAPVHRSISKSSSLVELSVHVKSTAATSVPLRSELSPTPANEDGAVGPEAAPSVVALWGPTHALETSPFTDLI